MCGIVSFLDEIHDELVGELCRDIFAGCTVTNKHLPHLPHFSWQVFEGCNYQQMDDVLAEIAAEAAPFQVRTSGLGVFTGEQRVVYISLIKDKFLMDFQKNIWDRTINCAQMISPFYNPDAWTPHITLFNGSNQDEDIICALDKLIKMDFVWEFTVNSIAMIGEVTGDVNEGQYLHPFVSSS